MPFRCSSNKEPIDNVEDLLYSFSNKMQKEKKIVTFLN